MSKYNTTTGDPVPFDSELSWGNAFHRSGPAPLDRTSLFVSEEDALKYARGQADLKGMSGSSYPGQIITVIQDDGLPITYIIKRGSLYTQKDYDDGVITDEKLIGTEKDKTARTLLNLSGGYWLDANGNQLT